MEYYHHYWATANKILSRQEHAIVAQNVSDRNHLKTLPRTPDGLYMIATGEDGINNKIVFTGAAGEKYSIDKIVEIKINNETELSKTREEIYVFESTGIQTENSEIFKVHTSSNGEYTIWRKELAGSAKLSQNSDGSKNRARSGGKTNKTNGRYSINKTPVVSNAIYSLKDSDGNTLSEKQQEFFKDSKAKDEKGRLLPLYHGSRSVFNIFDILKSGESSKEAKVGFWFTENKQGASNFANDIWYGEDENGVVFSVYLNIKNPKIYETYITNKDKIDEFRNQIKKLKEQIHEIYAKYS